MEAGMSFRRSLFALAPVAAVFFWAPPAGAVGIDVTYTGTLSTGSVTGDLPGAGSLVGDRAVITLTYNTTSLGSSFVSGPTSSSLTSIGTPGVGGSGGANAGIDVSIFSGSTLVTEVSSSNLGGTATDFAATGGMQQSLTAFSSFSGVISDNLFTGSVVNPAISGDITKALALNGIPLSAFFDISESGPFGFDFSGSLNFGSVTVSSPTAATPLPPAWTMMLIGIAGFGFVAYRQKSMPALRLAEA
jgi:hypothetical protein